MRIPADLVAYVGITLMLLLAVAHRLDPPAPSACRVGYVYDGDTVELLCEGGRRTARITGLDAPELKGRCPAETAAAEAAKRALAALVRGAKVVEVWAEGRDRYDRELIGLTLDGTDAAAAMIAAGHARAYDGGTRQGWC